MSEDVKTSKRDQVLSMVESGGMTRQDIAEQLGTTVASVSNQLTYLRWMGNYFIYDENKVLSKVDKETFEAWEAERKAASGNRGSQSAKTPQERANAMVKTIERQEKQLDGYREKLVKVNKELKAMPEDEALLDVKALVEANITILEIKLKQNRKTAEELPEPEEVEETGNDSGEDGDDLL